MVHQPRMTAQDKIWKAESDLRTIREAEDIKGDKSRLNAAKRMAKTEMKALAKITGKPTRRKR